MLRVLRQIIRRADTHRTQIPLLPALLLRNRRELGARLAALKGADGYAARFHAFDGEDHLTAMAGSIARALDFALRP